VTTVTATIPSALRIYTPPPPLGDFVAAIWHWEGDPGPHRYDRLLPTGAASLIVNDYGGRGFSCRDLEGRLWNFGTYDPWAEPSPDRSHHL
jgi:hypothetical protein